MTNYKEILRLHSLGINNTRIAESCGLCAQHSHCSPSAGRRTGAFLEQNQELQRRRSRQKVISIYCTGTAVQDAGLRMGTPRRCRRAALP